MAVADGIVSVGDGGAVGESIVGVERGTELPEQAARSALTMLNDAVDRSRRRESARDFCIELFFHRIRVTYRHSYFITARIMMPLGGMH
jgi:hypothetical protein